MAVETKEYRAEARFQRVSPQKARLVLDLIKGRNVQEALETAAFTKKRIAPVIHKLLVSAIDNAKYVSGEEGTDLDVDRLYVKQALANDGPRMKRIRPAPMGRAYRYQRRISHLEVVLAEKGAQAQEDLATVVGEEHAEAAAPAKKRKVVAAKKKPKQAAKHKKAVGK